MVEDDAIEVPLVVRALVEDDQRALGKNAPNLVVRASEVLLVVDVARLHGHRHRYVDRWRQLRHP